MALITTTIFDYASKGVFGTIALYSSHGLFDDSVIPSDRFDTPLVKVELVRPMAGVTIG